MSLYDSSGKYESWLTYSNGLILGRSPADSSYLGLHNIQLNCTDGYSSITTGFNIYLYNTIPTSMGVLKDFLLDFNELF